MTKIEQEIVVIEQMLKLHCQLKHKQALCTECKQLLDYAVVRLQKCKFGNEKPRCAKCPVHCYKPNMRFKIKAVMRFAGPRMLLYQPLVFAKHYLKK